MSMGINMGYIHNLKLLTGIPFTQAKVYIFSRGFNSTKDILIQLNIPDFSQILDKP